MTYKNKGPKKPPSGLNAFPHYAALYDAIAHGDLAHRSWLYNAILAFAKGEPIPRCDK